jgi:hypothetical protein
MPCMACADAHSAQPWQQQAPGLAPQHAARTAGCARNCKAAAATPAARAHVHTHTHTDTQTHRHTHTHTRAPDHAARHDARVGAARVQHRLEHRAPNVLPVPVHTWNVWCAAAGRRLERRQRCAHHVDRTRRLHAVRPTSLSSECAGSAAACGCVHGARRTPTRTRPGRLVLPP